MNLSDLPNDITFLIADHLGPKDWISIMATAHRFHDSLKVELPSAALTYSCSGGKSILEWAAINGREALFRTLLKRGAAVSKQDDDGNTVLHYLAARGSIQFVCLLLEKDIDVTLRNKKSETALLCAVQKGYENVVRKLLEAGADPATSITPGPEDEARRLLRAKIYANNTTRAHGGVGRKRGFNVYRYGEAFKKPLHFAAEKGYGSIVRLLLNADVDVSCTTFHNRSALHYAAIGGYENVFKQLSDARIDASIKDYFGMTAQSYLSTYLSERHNRWPSTPDRPSTLSRSSMARLMPGPLVSPLSSSLSAVVADSGFESPSAIPARGEELGLGRDRDRLVASKGGSGARGRSRDRDHRVSAQP